MEEEELEALLNDLAQQAEAEKGWGKDKWTREVKLQLVSRGNGMDLQTCASVRGLVPDACRPYWGEWLYDVVWLRGDWPGLGRRYRIACVPLVAEIEWGNSGDVCDDFQKLLVARADVRMMIFDEHHDLAVEDLIDQINFFNGNMAGDHYLLASYNRANQHFNVVEHVVG